MDDDEDEDETFLMTSLLVTGRSSSIGDTSNDPFFPRTLT